MESVIVRVKRENGVELPQYMTVGSAGMDVKANIDVPVTLKTLERCLIPTGLKLEIPFGYEIQVRPRSGLALKNGVTLLNSPGTIDSDYRGEIGIILINLGKEDFVINPGERVGQIVLQKVYKMEFEEVEELSETVRAEGGFGHTGKR